MIAAITNEYERNHNGSISNFPILTPSMSTPDIRLKTNWLFTFLFILMFIYYVNIFKYVVHPKDGETTKNKWDTAFKLSTYTDRQVL